MAEIKKYLHTLDIGNNKIINLLLNPLSTSDRTTVGGSLTTADEGYVCYDTDENVQYFWDGSTWVASGGGGSQTLQDVTDLGNTTTNNIQLLNAAETIYGAGGGILLDNGSRLREGTIDAGLGGSKGIAQICAVGYELKWEAGRLYVMNGNGNGIRQSLYNFTTTPAVTDDSLLGYAVGSLWTLDDGTVYECADATTGAAVWNLVNTGTTPNLQQVTDVDNNTTNDIIVGNVSTDLYSALYNTGQLALSNGQAESILQNTNVGSNTGISLNFPDTSPGDYIIPISVNGVSAGTDGSITIPVGSTVTPAALTKTDDTNVTLTLGGTPSTALLQATSMTLGWSGQLSIGRGGTGLSALGTANQLIRVNSGATALEYFTPTYLTSAVTSVATAGLISGGTITGTGTITTSMATNKLVGRSTAGPGIMEEITVGSGLTLTGAGVLNNTATPTPLGYYGAWQDNVTQTAAASNTGYAMIFRTIDIANGVSVVTNGTNLTRITFANSGVYNLQFSSQFQNLSNSPQDVTIWLRKYGTDVPGSSGFIGLEARKNPGDPYHIIASWNYLLDVIAGEYYELIWSTTDHTNVQMQYYAAGSPPPSAASVIMTVTQQSGIMAGSGITAINSLTGAAQTLTNGTSGLAPAFSSVGTTHTLNIPLASAASVTAGLISKTDYDNFTTAYTDRLKWDGGATGLVAATGRTSLGATTVGGNFFTLTNPSAITFPRINADNTVSTLDASTFRAAIGAGTSSTNGTVTSVAALTLGTSGTDLSSTVATGTTTPVITLNVPDASATARGVVTTGTQTLAGTKTLSGNTYLSTSTGVTRVNNSTVAWQGGSYTPTFAVYGTTSARALIHASDNTGGQVGSLAGTSVYSGSSGNFENIFAATNTYTTNLGTNPTILTGAGYSYFSRGNGGYYNYMSLLSNGTNSKTFNGFGNLFYYQTSGGALNLTGNLYGFRSTAQFVDAASSGITVTELDDIILENPTFTSGVTTITTRIGLNIAFNSTNVTNAWGVYQSNANVKNYFNGSVGLGTTAISASAILDISSTTKGFLPPRMTNAQRTAISLPAVGLIVYCTDTIEGLYINKSTGWTFII